MKIVIFSINKIKISTVEVVKICKSIDYVFIFFSLEIIIIML